MILEVDDILRDKLSHLKYINNQINGLKSSNPLNLPVEIIIPSLERKYIELKDEIVKLITFSKIK